MNSFTDLLSRFPGDHRKSADKWIATCPSCGGRQKLQITEGKFRAFLKCWKGCDEQSILLAAGIDDTRFGSPPPADPPRRYDTAVAPARPRRTLAPAHRSELYASGISDEIIVAMGVYTETEPAGLRALGFSAHQARCVPCMVFPSHTPDGRTLYQIKPDRPYRNEKGDVVKYMSPAGGNTGIGVLSQRVAELADVSVPLVATEGMKKMGAAETHGLLTLSFSGVWNWQRKNKETGERVPYPEWEQIALDGRTVYVAFDSDAMRKEDVHKALQALISYLGGRGALVKIVYLPDEDDGAKVGLDDYLAAGHTAEHLLSLADDVLRPIPPDFTQEAVKALQKRLRGKNAQFSATGVSFSSLDPLIVQSAGRAVHGIESDMRALTFWSWADIYIAASTVVKNGELQTTFARWFGQDRLRYAQNAASVARKFPADQFNRLIPPWVFQELASNKIDAETRQLILDTYEADGMTRQEVRVEVRKSLGLDPYPDTKPRTEDRPETEPIGINPLLREIKEQVPQDLLLRFLHHIKNYGTEEIEALFERRENEEHLSGRVHAGVNSSISFWDISDADLDCLPSGKYKGYALSEIEDDAYLGWLLEHVPAALHERIERQMQARVQGQIADHMAEDDASEEGADTDAAGAGEVPEFTPCNIEIPSIQEKDSEAGTPLRLVSVEPLDPDASPPDQGLAVVVAPHAVVEEAKSITPLGVIETPCLNCSPTAAAIGYCPECFALTRQYADGELRAMMKKRWRAMQEQCQSAPRIEVRDS
jgi:hypothetical protein